MIDGKTHVGIGFATGRSSFKNVLQAYMYHLDESGYLQANDIKLSLLVAYDLEYENTSKENFTSISEPILSKFEQKYFIGKDDIPCVLKELIDKGIINEKEAALCFGTGYASKRNIILYNAIKNNVDYLIFLDDDEYPMAVTKSQDYSLWSGQHVIEEHIRYLKFADVTNGCRCGYLSPMPSMIFDNILSENDFKDFIDAMSNDCISWEGIKTNMDNGGVTYADKETLINRQASLIEEQNNMKFVWGGHLGINLTNRNKVFPFYNPPGARGEDTFFGTCLNDMTVKRIPAYTFHDAFSLYQTLLQGVLPSDLRRILSFDSHSIVDRYYKACVGWIRYKPLLLYITDHENYDSKVNDIKEKFRIVIPRICAYFNNENFYKILTEFDLYNANVKKHFKEFEDTKKIWEKIKSSI